MIATAIYREVWKFPMTEPQQTFTVGSSARVVAVATQYGQPCLWIEVDPFDLGERRTYVGVGTGHTIREALDYQGTAHDVEGRGLVFHIYERPSDRMTTGATS